MLNVGGSELLIILLVALIFLGPTRLPEVARQIGQAAGALKSMASGFQAELDAATKAVTDPTMNLSGPTSQDDAIAATQPDGVPDEPATPGEPPALLAAARRSNYDDRKETPKSFGGPTDLSKPVTGAVPPLHERDDPVSDEVAEDQPEADEEE